LQGSLKALVVKELRELLRERLVVIGLIVMPALIMAFMGALNSVAIKKTVEEARQPLRVAITVEGQPTTSDSRMLEELRRILNASLAFTEPIRLLGEGYDAVIELAPGFSDRLLQGLPVDARVYVRLESPSPTAQARVGVVGDLVESAFRTIVLGYLKEHGLLRGATGGFLEKPVRANYSVVVWGKVIPSTRLYTYYTSLYAIPVALIIMLVAAIQAGAISMGMEREAKTIEMLLASPVSYRRIVLAKILGVLVVSLIGATGFLGGFWVYMKSLSWAVSGAPRAAGATRGWEPGVVAAAIASLAGDLYVAAVLGLILGLGARDLRGAQLVANNFAFLLMIPYFALFTGIAAPGTGGWLALLADPLYPPLAALMGAQFSRHDLVALAFTAELAHIALWTLVAVRLLQPERIIAGIPIREYLARRRRRPV